LKWEAEVYITVSYGGFSKWILIRARRDIEPCKPRCLQGASLASFGEYSVFSVLEISPISGKAFNTKDTEKFRKINAAIPHSQ
jgi:hypothetical protein